MSKALTNGCERFEVRIYKEDVSALDIDERRGGVTVTLFSAHGCSYTFQCGPDHILRTYRKSPHPYDL